MQDPTLPPPTTPGAHAADPVAIETATDFSRAGVLGKGSRDIQYKWDHQDDGGGGLPSAAPCARGFPLAAAPVSSIFPRCPGAALCLFTDNSCVYITVFLWKIKVVFFTFPQSILAICRCFH